MTQVYNIPVTRVFTNLGLVAVGYQLFFYETGTTTKKSVFADEALTTPLTNPVISDSNGYFPQIFLQGTGEDYKAILADDTDTDPPTSPIWTADPIEVDANDINAFGTRPAQHWGTTTNTAVDYQVTPDTGLSSYTDDLLFSLEIHTTNTGTATLAVSDLDNPGSFLTSLDINKYDNLGAKIDVIAGDLQGSQTYIFRIDSVSAVVLNPGKQPNVRAGTLTSDSLIIPTSSILDIATGAITVTDTRHIVDTEGATATDDLDTINGAATGQVLILSIEDDARNVVIKHGTGNIITNGGEDITLDVTDDRFVGISDGTNIVETSRTLATPQNFVATQTISNDSTIDFSDVFEDGFNYEIDLIFVSPAVDTYLTCRFEVGGVFQSGTNYVSGSVTGSNVDNPAGNTSNTDRLNLSWNGSGFDIESAGAKGYMGKILFNDPANSSKHKQVLIRGAWDNQNGNYCYRYSSGSYEGSTSAVTGIQFFMGSGNLASGTITITKKPNYV